MAPSPLSTPKFRNLFAAAWVLWSALHVKALMLFGFSITDALIDSAISNVLLLAICVLVSSVLRYYLPQRQRYIYILALCAVLTAIWFFISGPLIVLAINATKAYVHFFSQSAVIRIAVAFLVTGSMALISVLWYTLQDQQHSEKRKAEAEQLAKDAELYNLRQQLQPHFLFNSLNSISALINSQPQQARRMIQQLSDFLRGTLRKEEQAWVSLEEEFQHLDLYLGIEKVRFGHRLDAVVENKTSDPAVRLPALLLQPIVENAIKFGLYDTVDTVCISVCAETENEQLIVRVKNPYDPTTHNPQKGTGFGLRSVRRRMYLLFARNDLLHTETNNHEFTTTLKIPQHHDQSRNNR